MISRSCFGDLFSLEQMRTGRHLQRGPPSLIFPSDLIGSLRLQATKTSPLDTLGNL